MYCLYCLNIKIKIFVPLSTICPVPFGPYWEGVCAIIPTLVKKFAGLKISSKTINVLKELKFAKMARGWAKVKSLRKCTVLHTF